MQTSFAFSYPTPSPMEAIARYRASRALRIQTLSTSVKLASDNPQMANEADRTDDVDETAALSGKRRRRSEQLSPPSQSTFDLSTPKVAINPAQKLRNKALRMLTTREHSKEELLRKLSQAKSRISRGNASEEDREIKSRSKDDLEALVDQLAAQGWQSDDRYAEAMIRRLAGQASRRYIADKLAHAGIKKEVAQFALESLDQDDREVAKDLWERRYGEAPKDAREHQRQIRFLVSRGFQLSDAFRIVPRARTGSIDEPV